MNMDPAPAARLIIGDHIAYVVIVGRVPRRIRDDWKVAWRCNCRVIIMNTEPQGARILIYPHVNISAKRRAGHHVSWTCTKRRIVQPPLALL